jgi:uroporphyrinogen decarboxylase
MQMGFQAYLDLLLEDRPRFWSLMKVNQEFCVEWGNRQLEAGATTIAYLDPVSSGTVVPRSLYLETGHKVARETLARIKGPCVTHLASGRCAGLAQDIVETGSVGLGVSALDDLGEVKRECGGRMAVIGNLNAIEMVRWTRKAADAKVREAMSKAAAGGGFILSDNHGELPFQVPWGVIGWVMDAALRHGRYG